jgi:hypothetical protein
MRTLHALRRTMGMTLVVAMLFVTVGSSGGCFRQQFDVGTGGAGVETREFRQWFALWGLVPITDVQERAEQHAGGAENYTVRSEFTPIDFLFGLLTGIVTIYPKTMTVER